MNNVFYIGATGLDAQQTAIDVTANNIANVNTPAFKRGAVAFTELLTTAPASLSRNYSSEIANTPAGVAADASLHVYAPGTLRSTGNTYDLAVRGDGFIELAPDSGQTLLWRGGTLHVGADGYLATADGRRLRAMISVPRDASAITISATGQVQATVPSQTDPLNIGEIELLMPADVRTLESVGGGVYRTRDDALSLTRVRPGEDNAGLLAQGFSEASNVSLSDELVGLMLYQRTYAANARLVQVGDELMSIANGLKR
ncbi:flagellar hook-basal body protein [Burkholderia stagnalis]|uniref:flagellar hook-basal body protein n=1 Tax=Burkholderia stagnalis TaxID=1503054 RepID=UPI000F5ECBEB|nr:flagellar hook-basal body protein [Burkholderia stagnalis]RQX94970.1 flagellar hook-basal body protein [Burkholderia stagnalis]RQY32522.1 flagellar hook-basal body protein [Burkholderia stagnalis]RQY49597.1 flagellar hook-basal body protein [Burkholderia stagnalis]RQY56606.1 flagellar hook-basal body protein [Burkholderia stagnalis]RQY86380.1 flagellar hook-basal body protein [Burkholderia stagnalis]